MHSIRGRFTVYRCDFGIVRPFVSAAHGATMIGADSIAAAPPALCHAGCRQASGKEPRAAGLMADWKETPFIEFEKDRT
jgi:hypothetical protein